MDLQEIRDYVRLHMDLDPEDLPDAVLDVFIREGSRKVESSEQRWPFYEAIFTFNQTAATASVALTGIDASLKRITQVVDPDGRRLKWISRDEAQRLFPVASTGVPSHYSEWSGSVTFHPTPEAETLYTVEGYRKQIDWVADGTGAEPDMPEELHNTVALWAMHRAYAQQEDLEQSAVYRQLFDAELNELGRRFCEMPLERPMVLNGGPVERFVRPVEFVW